jgi:hypothetical protein
MSRLRLHLIATLWVDPAAPKGRFPMKVLKQLLSFFLTVLSVSVSGQTAKPEISPVRDAGRAMSIAFILLPWATAGLSIGFVAYFLTHPHSRNPRSERIPSGFFGKQSVWPFIGAMTLTAGVGFGAAVVLPNRTFGKYLRTMCKT